MTNALTTLVTLCCALGFAACSTAGPATVETLDGCWHLDGAHAVATNTAPSMAPARAEELWSGVWLRFSPAGLTHWFETDDVGRHYTIEFPATYSAEPGRKLKVALSSPIRTPTSTPGRMPVADLSKSSRQLILQPLNLANSVHRQPVSRLELSVPNLNCRRTRKHLIRQK